MLKKNILNIPKLWFKFTKPSSNGRKLQLRWEQLSEQRYKEFIEFYMNYYVKREITHIAAGIPKNQETMKEYRQILSKCFKHPSYHTAVCVDSETNDIVAFDSLVLYKKEEIYDKTIQTQNPDLKRYFQILSDWNDIFPIQKVLEKYNVNLFMDDAGLAIHPNYTGHGITLESYLLRAMVCKANNVPLTGAWSTATASQKAADRYGCTTIYEIKSEEIEEILGIRFQNPPPIIQYNIKHID